MFFNFLSVLSASHLTRHGYSFYNHSTRLFNQTRSIPPYLSVFFRYSYFLSAGRAVILFSRLTLLLFSQPLNRVTFCDLKTGPRLFMINNREKIQKNIAATETLNRCCLNAGPPFAMLRHH